MDAATEKDINTVIDALRANRFAPVTFVETAEHAKRAILDMIPSDATFAIAGSTTVSQLGLTEWLMKQMPKDTASSENPVSIDEMIRRPADVMVCSSNAVTLDGKLVNMDGTGNRVSNMIFGPKKVILVIGMNKIVSDVDEALDRIKNVIAPYHAKVRGCRTPCAKTGTCIDCDSPERICNVTTIIEKKPRMTDMAIIVVGEDLGLGWNPDWDEARKEGIAIIYRQELEKMMQAIAG